MNIMDQQTTTPAKTVKEWQDYNSKKKKSEKKKTNDSSQRGHNINKWNFHNFQTPEYTSCIKKIRSYPFECWETVWSVLC